MEVTGTTCKNVATIWFGKKCAMMTFASRSSRVFTFIFGAEHFVIATSAGLLMFIFCTNQKPRYYISLKKTVTNNVLVRRINIANVHG
jgi:hypothetical protein